MKKDNTNFEMSSSKTIDFAISNDKRNSILNGKTALATLFGAGSAVAFISAQDLINDDVDVIETTEMESADCTAQVEMNDEINVVSDEMSFGEAFAMQRELQGAGGIFKYKDNYYNTYYEEEWNEMTDTDRADYFASLDQNINYGNSKVVDNNTGESIYLNIDQDETPEIVVSDSDNDGIMEVDKVDLNNDGTYDVIHEQGTTIPSVESDFVEDEILDMEEGFEELEDFDFPEELEFLPEDNIIDTEVESFVIDEGESIENSTEEFIDEGDMIDPSDDFVDDGDLIDPEVEETVVEDIIDNTSASDLTDASDDIDLSEFDF